MPGAGQVAITYSVIGFVFAFLIGVPLAKLGLKKGLASHPEKIKHRCIKRIYPPEQQTETCGKITTYNGNIDVLAFHMALVGLTFVITLYVQKLILLAPVSFVKTIGSMTFFVGLFVAYGVKWVLGKLNLKQYHDDIFTSQNYWLHHRLLNRRRIYGSTDVCHRQMVNSILVMCVVVGAVTLGFALFFGSRLGGTCDFERTLGLWGCLTGTCPSGVASIRIVDPNTENHRCY